MKFGYVLSGGGARGIAHLGVIKALEENDIRPAAISGTSAGAIIGAFYAQGYSPGEILKIISGTKLYKILRPSFNLKGLISLEKSYSFFRKFFKEDTYESLAIPLFATAVNVKTGSVNYFSSGQLIRTLFASSAIPVIFNPVNIEGELYIDGGVLNNLPVEPLSGNYDRILGFHCNPVGHEYKYTRIRNLIERTFLLSVSMNVMSRREKCDLFFEPAELSVFGAFDFAKAKEIYQTGYQYAVREMPGLLKVMS